MVSTVMYKIHHTSYCYVSAADYSVTGRGGGHQSDHGLFLIRALLRHLLQVLGAGQGS